MASNAALRREGDALVLTGALDRAAVIALWPAASQALDGVAALDLRGVERVDSAGVAFLAELVARLRARRSAEPTLLGSPAGLAELASAYRLTSTLDFQASPPSVAN